MFINQEHEAKMKCAGLCPPLMSSVGRVREGRACWCRLSYTREQRTAWNLGQKETDKRKRNRMKKLKESFLEYYDLIANISVSKCDFTSVAFIN